MHNLLKGVVQYKFRLLFQHHVINAYISINMLFDRIQSFNYGYTECNNNPSGLKMDNNKHLGLNAIPSWFFLINTPLIFGDVAESENNHWNVVLLSLLSLLMK